MPRHRAEPARAQRRIGQRADPQRDVDAVADDVDQRIGQPQLDADRWIGRHELGKHRRDGEDSKGQGRRDANQPGGRAGGIERSFFRRAAFAQDALCALGEAAAAVGERQPARGAVKQRGPEPRLEPADRLRDRRLGQAPAPPPRR